MQANIKTPPGGHSSPSSADPEFLMWQRWLANNKGITNTMITLKIQVIIDFDDEQKTEAIIEAAKEAARLLNTQATIIADKRTPQVTLRASRMFEQDSLIEYREHDVDDS